MGYFGFDDPHMAYIEVVSFDRLVNSATKQNRASSTRSIALTAHISESSRESRRS